MSYSIMDVVYESWLEGYEPLRDYIYSRYHFEYDIVLAPQEEGDVYALQFEDDWYVVKSRVRSSFQGDVCNECIRREYEVGRLLNELHSLYLIQTFGYFEVRQPAGAVYSYLVLEKAAGKTLAQVQREGLDILPCIRRLLLHILPDLQRQADFVHYDLHLRNVVIDLSPQHAIRSMKIIDYGYSHVRGIPAMFYEGLLSTIYTPGVFDPQIDIAVLLLQVDDRLQDREVFALLQRNGLLQQTGNNYYINPGMPAYIFGALYQDNKVWAAVETNGLSLADFDRLYIQATIDLVRDYYPGITFEEIELKVVELFEEKDSRYRYYNVANFALDDFPEIAADWDAHVEHFTQELGRTMGTEKMRQMRTRPYSNADIAAAMQRSVS